MPWKMCVVTALCLCLCDVSFQLTVPLHCSQSVSLLCWSLYLQNRLVRAVCWSLQAAPKCLKGHTVGKLGWTECLSQHNKDFPQSLPQLLCTSCSPCQSPCDCIQATYTCGCSKVSRQPGQNPIFVSVYQKHGVTTTNAVPSFFMLLFERVQSSICSRWSSSSRTVLSARDIPGRESVSWSSSEFVF